MLYKLSLGLLVKADCKSLTLPPVVEFTTVSNASLSSSESRKLSASLSSLIPSISLLISVVSLASLFDTLSLCLGDSLFGISKTLPSVDLIFGCATHLEFDTLNS